MFTDHLQPVALSELPLLFNLGGTSLVSAAFEGKEDVMPATWVCPLNYDPARVTACVDSCHYTRPLIEKSGMFALALPTAAIVNEVMYLGHVSENDEPAKLEKSGAKFFKMAGYDMPFVEGCAAYAVFRVLPEPHIEKTYDLFIGVAAVADWRVADRLEGKWKKDAGLPQLRLVENPDILAAVGHRAGGPVTIGFAAEATDLLENAYAKLEKKGAAMIVANVARDALASDTNRVLVVTDGEVDEIGPADKDEVARKILYHAVDLLEEEYGPEDDL